MNSISTFLYVVEFIRPVCLPVEGDHKFMTGKKKKLQLPSTESMKAEVIFKDFI